MFSKQPTSESPKQTFTLFAFGLNVYDHDTGFNNQQDQMPVYVLKTKIDLPFCM